MTTPNPEFLRFTTHKSLTQRLVLSTLTGRPIHVSQIRSSSPTNPGLAPHEISFLRLLDSITNGSSLQISYTGTTFTYIPGLITGSVVNSGDVVKCALPESCRRGVSWFLIPLCMLAPFSKAPLNVRFEGEGVITSATETGDVSVDSVRTAILPLYEQFGIMGAKLELRVLQRSCAGSGAKGGGGVVELRFCGDRNDPGKKKRTGVGFGLALIAESSAEGVIYSADVAAPSSGGVTPEDIGKQCAYQLLENISQGGCVTRVGAGTVLTLMAMGSEDVGRVRLGRDVLGTEDVILLARDLKKFGASSWGMRDAEDDETGDIIVSVKGIGVGNVGRKVA
ncbi:RNA 3'-terminal phosphate cyclase-like protein [Lachnellula subtilissima]|uniref:RNA 3'-terminal phosphate cyclase-like protein n=1 Tax=Lachnellula subtilissima TaxID=602034 RepID=A0A8H8RZP4_9HELO|nr:RNA 3'-terminal phosphate cyclase-like protein [Lachnellula subtilissima]